MKLRGYLAASLSRRTELRGVDYVHGLKGKCVQTSFYDYVLDTYFNVSSYLRKHT
jgi:hypothetical protein